MPTSPDHTTPAAPPLTYNGIAVEPVPGHPGVYSTPAACAVVDDLGGFGGLSFGIFACWAPIPASTKPSRSGHTAADGQEVTTLVWDRRGLDDGTRGIVVAVPTEAQP